MKLAKTIIIIVLAVLLTLSTFVNIFIFNILEITDVESFKQVLLCRELMESLGFIEGSIETPAEVTTEEELLEPVPEISSSSGQAFTYSNAWIKVTKLKQSAGFTGPAISFEIENLSAEPVLISFREVYIDGYKADLSGLYCECLDPGMKAIEDLTLWESDWEAFTNKPSEVQFIIEVCDPSTLGTLERSSTLVITLS